MPNILFSVRLSPRLAAVLDRASDYLDCSPSQLVETLLRRSGTYQDELLKIPVQGPFTEKRNLRLRPEAIQQLRRLTRYRKTPSGEPVYDIEPSVYIRSVIAYFFSRPQAFQSVVPNAPRAEEWARVLEEEERMLRARQTPRVALPGEQRVGILIFILPFLVLLIIGILDLFKKDEDTGHESDPPSREET
ncbi:MAG: hypothetical protein ACE1Z6_05765 [Candidatus Methylomirabilales bacterium]|nr:hypothetical protein [candidate division NC10 bacterium]